MPRNIFALLVAINKYSLTSSPKVNSLFACVNDKNRFQGLLEKQYNCKPEQIKSLVNSEATKDGIISNFRNHLCKNPAINEGDIVLFYFGGHGSYTSTTSNYEAYDSKEQDETIVCYDSRTPQIMDDLRDKEIAALLTEVPKGVEIVLIIDSCHSGSISRNSEEIKNEFIPRYLPPITAKSRIVSTDALSKNVSSLNLNKGTLSKRDHIALSACNRTQEAWEKNGRGVFTNHLIDILEKSKGYISYTQLFERVCAAVLKDFKSQTPEIFFPSQLDPNTIFLQRKTTQNIPPLQVEFSNGNWCLNHGAIYGLNTKGESNKKIQVAIYKDTFHQDQLQFIGNVEVEAVKLKECHLPPDLFDKNLGVKDLNNFFAREKKRKEISFRAKIISVPPSMFIYLNGSEKDRDDFFLNFNPSDAPYIDFVQEAKGINYELVLEKDQLLINDLKTGRLIHGCQGRNKIAIKYILNILNQMEEWSRLVELNNEKTKLDSSKVEVQFWDENTGKYAKNEVVNFNQVDSVIFYEIQARNLTNKNLYISLLHLNREFGISCFYSCTEIIADNKKWITLDDQHGLNIPSGEQIQSVTDIFKIIVSTEKIDDYKFLKRDIELGKIKEPESMRDSVKRAIVPPESDWFIHTLVVNLFQ